MSPYEGGQDHFKMAGYASFTPEDFTVFNTGMLIARSGDMPKAIHVNWAWGFLSAYNLHKQWKKEQQEQQE